MGGPVPGGFTPYSATFVSAEQGWVLGSAPCGQPPCTSIVRTRDGGASWRGIPAPQASLAPPGDERGGVTTLRFADPLNGWAAGNGLYATHDGGASWHQVAAGPAGGVITALGTGGGMVYASLSRCPAAGGTPCSPSTVVYAASVGSDQWSAVSPTLPGGGERGMVVQGADWYLPLPGGIYHGHGNAAPTPLPNPCPQYPSNPETPAVAVADAEHLDAMCASGGAAGSASYQLFGTTDGGQHWTKAGPTHMEASGLFGLADNGRGVLLVATASGGSEILRSTDDGTTWPMRRSRPPAVVSDGPTSASPPAPKASSCSSTPRSTSATTPATPGPPCISENETAPPEAAVGQGIGRTGTGCNSSLLLPVPGWALTVPPPADRMGTI